MSAPVSDLSKLLATMSPELNPSAVAFIYVPDREAAKAFDEQAVFGTFREREGLTLIVKLAAAQSANVEILFRAAWITLTVHSDLEAVGLTAAFAAALTEAGISCNVVAACFHDHIFVPIEKAPRALAVLKDLQARAEQASRGDE